MSFWNHFDTVGPRTNNNIEGYNNKLKLYVGAAKPNIYKILQILKNEETSTDKAFRQAIATPPFKPPPKKSYYVEKEIKFNIFKNLYEHKNICLDTYLENIIGLYQFDKKKSLTEGDYTDLDSAISDTSNETYDVSDRSVIEDSEDSI